MNLIKGKVAETIYYGDKVWVKLDTGDSVIISRKVDYHIVDVKRGHIAWWCDGAENHFHWTDTIEIYQHSHFSEIIKKGAAKPSWVEISACLCKHVLRIADDILDFAAHDPLTLFLAFLLLFGLVGFHSH